MKNKRKKLKNLTASKTPIKTKSKFIPSFIINKSDVALDDREITLLNNGLNFALPHNQAPLHDIIVDAEIALNKMETEVAEFVRGSIKRVLSKKSNDRKYASDASDLYGAVKSLNKKKIFITKADKGNCVFVLNEDDYNNGMNDLIEEGNYISVKNPLPSMKTKVLKHRQKYSDLFGYQWEKRMHKSYVRVPCLYGLYKAHKPGNTFRPIIAGYTSPVANIAVWLSNYFKKLKSFDKFSIKNSFELIDKLHNKQLEPNQRLVSLDITSYFSNVPRKGAMEALRIWLDKQDLNPLIANALFDLTQLCINQSYFQFRDEFYEQLDGLPMGLNISPFLCNLFMNTIEERLIENSLFPAFYCRYVDDCAAIVEMDKIDETLALFNSGCNEIQFTYECEENNELPFLDLMLKHSFDGSIKFNIHRKSTATDRFIPVESNHHHSHKLAAFNSMTHRLVNVPMSEYDYAAERTRIFSIAETNGYCINSIEQLITKHKRKKEKKESSFFFSEASERETLMWCGLSFDPYCFDAIKKSLKIGNVCAAPKTTTKLKSLLKSTKDKCDNLDKPGVYTATCSHKLNEKEECGKKYTGQTTRTLRIRSKEHLKHIEKIEPSKSGIAEHALLNKHYLSQDDFKLIKSESNVNRLNILESLHIYLNRKTSVNRDIGPHYSSLFSVLK